MANMGYDENLPTQTPAPMSERVASPWQGDYDFPPSVDVVRYISCSNSNKSHFDINMFSFYFIIFAI